MPLASIFEITGGVVSGGPETSSRAIVRGKPAAITSLGPCETAPSPDTVKVLIPSVLTLMFPTLKPAKLVSEPVGAPSSLCNTSAGGTVIQAVACANSTFSTTSLRGKSQPLLCPDPVEIIATAG